MFRILVYFVAALKKDIGEYESCNKKNKVRVRSAIKDENNVNAVHVLQLPNPLKDECKEEDEVRQYEQTEKIYIQSLLLT